MVQTRGYAFFSRGPKSDIAIVEEEANRLPNDASRQAALYRELLAEGDAASVIRRFEDRRWARDRECVVQYLVALFETSQLERAVGAFLSQSHPSASPSSAPPADMPRLVIGTKERPVVVQVEGGRGSGWRRVGTVVNIVFVGGLLYAMLGMNEQRLEGLTGRVHKQFGPEDTSKLATFDDVQGCDEAKQELEDIVAFLKDPGRFTRHGAHMPRGILLVGPPGTGKTLLARAVAGEAGVPFFYASGSSFDELFVGVGSMRIRKLFEAARKSSPAIVFIDELDAIGSKRNPRDPQHARMSLNQLLTELDGFAQSSGVIVLAATNIPEALDRALLRPGRFDKQVHVPLPDMRGRRAILERYIAKGSLTLAPDVDVPLLARGTPGFSGADLAKLVNQARIMASLANEPELRQAHLEASKDEMIMGAERKSALIAPEERLLTAYHEGGHALVALRSQSTRAVHIDYIVSL